MIARFRRYFRRRKLVPYVGALPLTLRRSYGGRETYSAAQVERALEKLQLPATERAIAFAACCSLPEFAAANPGKSEAEFDTLRGELIDLFEIWPRSFTCLHLFKLRNLPKSAGSLSDHYDSADAPGGHHGGDA
jgi:hypothetical protein